MATPHIEAGQGDIAEAVLLPGDPRRAAYIAETFLQDARQVTAVRNMVGFTGTHEDMPVTVMGTGMGIPSASIYVTELIREYGAQRLVRVGSCGGISANVDVRDLVVAIAAATDSAVNRARYHGWDYAAAADYDLLRAMVDEATASEATVHVGVVHSSDSFYNPVADAVSAWQRMGILAVEMEAAGLYAIAAEEGVRAVSILTVSDHVVTGAATSSIERERTFDDMVRVALRALAGDAA